MPNKYTVTVSTSTRGCNVRIAWENDGTEHFYRAMRAIASKQVTTNPAIALAWRKAGSPPEIKAQNRVDHIGQNFCDFPFAWETSVCTHRR